MRKLKRWITILDSYELNIVISKEIDNFWYKQKLAELGLLLEMKNRRNTDFLQMAHTEIKNKLSLDRHKLELLNPHNPSHLTHNSISTSSNCRLMLKDCEF